MLPTVLLAFQSSKPIRLNVDLRSAFQGIIRVSETIPTKSGKRAFYFPKFIPGEHRASGPINGMVDLHFFSGSSEIRWQRDPVELFKFWVDVPKNAEAIRAEFAYLSDTNETATPNVARIKWNRLLLYPEGKTTDALTIQVIVARNTGLATALTSVSRGAYEPVSVTELIDSPGILGRYLKYYELDEISGAKVGMCVMAEEQGYEQLPEVSLAKVKELVRQAGLLFGGRHFRKYDFLVTLSDAGAGAGLEHHESSEDGSGLKAASDLFGWGGLLAHEFAHSWNGKYRRPAGLTTPNFHQPMDGEGLWVYEGLTQYLGYVLEMRSGFATTEQWRDNWASVARSYQLQGGRSWRPVVDTARSVGLVRGVAGVWGQERRGTDYYRESSLVWLEADCLIRRGSKGTKSLDDFLRLFHGGVTDAPVVKPYRTADVIKALNTVYPYDWAAFLRDRIDRVHPDTPANSLEAAGFRLVLTDAPSTVGAARPAFLPMLGVTVGVDGVISELALNGSAVIAGIAPGSKVTAMDGAAFGLPALVAKLSQPGSAKIVLEVERAGKRKSLEISYAGGPFVPHLEPISGQPSLLDSIARPLGQ